MEAGIFAVILLSNLFHPVFFGNAFDSSDVAKILMIAEFIIQNGSIRGGFLIQAADVNIINGIFSQRLCAFASHGVGAWTYIYDTKVKVAAFSQILQSVSSILRREISGIVRSVLL